MSKKDQLKEELKNLAEQIKHNIITNQPTARLKAEFKKKSLEYKRYWLKENYPKKPTK